MLSEVVNRFYYGYLSRTEAAQEIRDLSQTPDALDLLLLVLVRESFQAGARWELRESAKLSPHIARFLEMVVLLGPDPGRDEWFSQSEIDGMQDARDAALIGADEREPEDLPIAPSELRDDIPF
jgi:hypothetical protein